MPGAGSWGSSRKPWCSEPMTSESRFSNADTVPFSKVWAWSVVCRLGISPGGAGTHAWRRRSSWSTSLAEVVASSGRCSSRPAGVAPDRGGGGVEHRRCGAGGVAKRCCAVGVS